MAAYSVFLILCLRVFIYGYQPDVYVNNSVVPIKYNLSDPSKIYILPHTLNEISGITEIDATTVASIQDENGILFIYDLKKEQIRNYYSFYYPGDYEGIARVDNTVFVLRSDGALFEIENYESSNFKLLTYMTGIPGNENEGLCFDQKANRLLIAPKYNKGKDSEIKNKRFIYSFDLLSKKLVGKPAFIIDLSVIDKFVLENKIDVPMKSSKKGHKKEPDINFRPSAIGIHPLTNKLFVLSGMEKLLFVFNMNGMIEYVEKLDSDLFNQPEGITFMKNGDLLISNEGKKNKPTIVRFTVIRN